MAGATARLENAYRAHTRERFAAAVSAMDRRVRTLDDVPRDTGKLRAGLRVVARPSRGAYLTAEFRSTARRAGFDYPSFIDTATRISPTTKKWLRFKVGGATVYSKGFPNRNRGWYGKARADIAAQWKEALGTSFSKGVSL